MNYRGQILNRCYIFSRQVGATAIYDIWELRSVYSAGIFFLFIMNEPVHRFSPETMDRFRNRFQTLAGTRLDNIIYPMEMGDWDDRLYVIFVKPDGYPVGDWRGFYYRSNVKTLFFRDFVKKVFPLAFDIIKAISQLHEEGYRFNQINPMNVWITGEPDNRAVYLKSGFSDFYDFSDSAVIETLANPVIYGSVRIDSIHLGNQPHGWDYVSLGLLLFHLLSSINPERLADRALLKTVDWIKKYLDPLEPEMRGLLFGILQGEDKKTPLNELCRKMLMQFNAFKPRETASNVPAEPRVSESDEPEQLDDTESAKPAGNFLVRLFRKLFPGKPYDPTKSRRNRKSLFDGFRWGVRRKETGIAEDEPSDVLTFDEMPETADFPVDITETPVFRAEEQKVASRGPRYDFDGRRRNKRSQPETKVILPAGIPYSQELLTRDRTRAIIEALNAHYSHDKYEFDPSRVRHMKEHQRLPERTSGDYKGRESLDFNSYIESRRTDKTFQNEQPLPNGKRSEPRTIEPEPGAKIELIPVTAAAPRPVIDKGTAFLDLELSEFAVLETMVENKSVSQDNGSHNELASKGKSFWQRIIDLLKRIAGIFSKKNRPG